MEAIELIGFALALCIGGIMGLFGGGGSLVVPLMIYVFGEDITTATGYALFLVGLTASFGVADKFRKREVDFATATAFALPVIVGTLFARIYLIHWIPDILWTLDGWVLTKKTALLFVFASLLLLSFSSMIGLWGKNIKPDPTLKCRKPGNYYGLVIGIGLAIGCLSSLVGAGGGVLIVPVLVMLIGMDMKMAAGTSLTIAAVKSFFGFSADVYTLGSQIDWVFLFSVVTVMVFGILMGSFVSNYLPGDRIKKGFAWFILCMAIFIIGRETGLIL